MAERYNRLQPNAMSLRVPRAAAAAALEDQYVAGRRELQNLLADNQRLVAAQLAIKQDLSVTQQERRRLSASAAAVKAERDAEVREIYERSLKTESEVRSMEAMTQEIDQVRADIQEMSMVRQELREKLREIDGELASAKVEALQMKEVQEEIEALRKDIQRGRAAIELEKKTSASNLEHKQAMEKNMMSMAREIEKLRGELANSEKRARAAAAAAANPGPGYAASYGSPDMVRAGSSYLNPYSMHQVQSSADTGSHYGSGATPNGP